MIELHEDGESFAAIARILNSEDVPTVRGGKWDGTKVRAVLVRHGRVAPTPPERIAERFWPETRLDPRTGCLLWTASTLSSGYGKFAVDGVTEPAHRVAWALERIPIPDGFDLHHICHVRTCVNPEHLVPVAGKGERSHGHLERDENEVKDAIRSGKLMEEALEAAARGAGGSGSAAPHRIEAGKRSSVPPATVNGSAAP